MKIGVIPQNPIERLLLAMGRVPTPIFDTMMAMMLARTIMVATKHGLFEALAPGPLTADEVAKLCKTHPRATEEAEKGSGVVSHCGAPNNDSRPLFSGDGL
jgi:hypothetical protein